MSRHAAYRRVPVDQQAAQNLRTINIPAPTRGIILDENEAFMAPGGALIQDNWMPTMRGSKLRGGSKRWCDLHSADAGGPPPLGDPNRRPVISGFRYTDGNIHKMFAGQPTKLWDVSTNTPVLVASGMSSGNWASAQLTNSAGVNTLTAVNDNGADFPMQYNGSTWTTLSGGQITGPGAVAGGKNLTFVWKYRRRLFFIQASSMTAWYLGIDSIAGTLSPIPLSGSASLGGKLLCGFSWSLDAGDGLSEKCVFLTDQGELLIFSGSDPSDVNNWRQDGRYKIAPPMGMNAFCRIGGDMLIMTTEGIVPLSQAITKTAEQLDLAALTRAIKPMWRDEVLAKRGWAWSMEKWDEFGGIFVTWPGGPPGKRYCAAANSATGAWGRFVGWDATCFLRQRGDMFFGTQDGLIQQADRTGYDDAIQDGVTGVISGNPYVATLVGGWEMFQSAGGQAVWHQARASFTSNGVQPFQPQLDCTTDYVVVLPTPPPAGPDPGVQDVWDQGLWDVAKFDQPSVVRPPVRNTMWVSIGKMGFSHAPICQVTVAQQATPDVELIAIAATYERSGVNV